MSRPSKVAIIGGGISGLAVAIALAQIGVACHLYENGDPKEGASISFSGRAADALEELGLYHLISKKGRSFPPDTGAAAMRDSTGKILTAGPKRPSWPGMKDTVVIFRPTLIDTMAEVARNLGVKVTNGVTFTDIKNHSDGVSISFTDGSRLGFDFFIGADGIASDTRRVVFPDSPKPEYAGQMSIRWMAPGQHVEGESWYHSPVGRFGFCSLPEGKIYVASILDMFDGERLTEDEADARFAQLLE